MIKLVDLLLENEQKPKAVFLAGPAGSGKSTFVKQYLSNKDLKSINIDDTYEELLRASGLDKPQAEYGAEELSSAAKLMGQARKDTTSKLQQSMDDSENLIIDGTGAASNPIAKKKQQLEDLGYETFMAFVYVSPLTSLQRNKERGEKGGRALRPSIILRTWDNTTKNIETFEKMFGDNFVILDNDPKEAIKDYSQEQIDKYFATVTYTGKPKSPEEQRKKDKEQKEMVANIKQALSNTPDFDDQSTITNKINSFIG